MFQYCALSVSYLCHDNFYREIHDHASNTLDLCKNDCHLYKYIRFAVWQPLFAIGELNEELSVKNNYIYTYIRTA